MSGNFTTSMTAGSVGSLFPVLVGMALLFAILGLVFYAVSHRFEKVGGVLGWFGRQLHNAVYGLIPAAGLAALGGAGYGLASMSGDARETGAWIVVGVAAGFMVLALLGAAWKRVLVQVKKVHPEWWNPKEDA